MDAHLPNWLWPVLMFAGIGAFIDFCIGRSGRAALAGEADVVPYAARIIPHRQ
jgi:hypothetical protein